MPASLMHSQRVSLLGVPIDPIDQERTVTRMINCMHDGGQHHMVTTNNEMLVMARHNKDFHTILQATSLNLPDSTGLKLGAMLTFQWIPHRVTGVDTVMALCKKLTPKDSVFLLGAAPGVAEKAAKALQAECPDLVIAGTHAGSPKAEDAPGITRLVNESDANVLFVAYGAPQQDVWIDYYLYDMPRIGLAMGVGGTFDFLAGVQKRAPKLLRAIGLEWLWRFIHEPSRWRRMWNAVVVFPLLVLRYGRKSPYGR